MEKRRGSKSSSSSSRVVSVVSCSFGRDSIAMLLLMLENPHLYPKPDAVVFINTGMEFDALYRARDAVVSRFIKANGIPFREISIADEFQTNMFDRIITPKNGGLPKKGFGWCGGVCRWGTSMKLQAISRFYRTDLPELIGMPKESAYGRDYVVQEFIGLAYDEMERCNRESNRERNKTYPLVEQQITQTKALEICYKHGIFFDEYSDRIGTMVYMYEELSNLSCRCCRNKNKKEIEKYRYVLAKKYLEELLAFQDRISEPFYKKFGDSGPAYTVGELVEQIECKRGGTQKTLFDLADYPTCIASPFG